SLHLLANACRIKLHSYWQDRVVAGEVEIGTANKSIGHFGVMFRAINESKQLNLPPIFDRILISGAKTDSGSHSLRPSSGSHSGPRCVGFPERGGSTRHLSHRGDRASAFRGKQSLPRNDSVACCDAPHLCCSSWKPHQDRSIRAQNTARRRRFDGHARAFRNTATRLTLFPPW